MSARSRTFIEDLLTISLFALAIIIAAYVFLPDFQRGIQTLGLRIEAQVSGTPGNEALGGEN